MKSIYLIGFMGSGKTTIARELASKLEIVCLDTDQQLEEITGDKIPDIFENKGEPFFREKEEEVLRSMPVFNAVIATGGGIIGREKNREWMRSNGVVVFLETSWKQVVERLGVDPSRPLWKGKEKEDLFRSRYPIYLDVADFVINTDQKAPDEVAEEIIAQINKFNQ